MALERHQIYGEHVFLTGESARETIEKALDHLYYRAVTDSRTEAYRDCTNYWKEEIKKVIDFSAPATAQIAKIKHLLGIED